MKIATMRRAPTTAHSSVRRCVRRCHAPLHRPVSDLPSHRRPSPFLCHSCFCRQQGQSRRPREWSVDPVQTKSTENNHEEICYPRSCVARFQLGGLCCRTGSRHQLCHVLLRHRARLLRCGDELLPLTESGDLNWVSGLRPGTLFVARPAFTRRIR